VNRARQQLLIAGNWKMHTTLEEAIGLADAFRERLDGLHNVECALFPPYPWIVPLSARLAGSSLRLGAQNCATSDEGALTGEVSARMIRPFCRYVIVGHSERRHQLGESDEMVAAKVRAALRNDLAPILCVGELFEERQSKGAEATVERQLGTALSGLGAGEVERVIIAYEPVWAIGTGRPATPRDAEAMARFMRRWIGEQFGDPLADRLRVLYGGSVNAQNVLEFLRIPEIDGVLVGGASLNVEEFSKIVEVAAVLWCDERLAQPQTS